MYLVETSAPTFAAVFNYAMISGENTDVGLETRGQIHRMI